MAYKHNAPARLKINITEYLKREAVVKNTPSRITPYGVYRLVKGRMVPEAEFLAAHPKVDLYENEFTKEKIGSI